MSKEAILINIRSNTNLMILSSKTIPEGILDEMFSSIESNMGKDAIDHRKVTAMKNLLAGSKYIGTGEISGTSASVFGKDAKGDSDFSFITDKKQKGTLF